MTDTKIYARCTNPKVDYLTDGKLYEVFTSWGECFKIKNDDLKYNIYKWNVDAVATWERVEQQDPPQWALDKAAKAARSTGWNDYCISWGESSGQRQFALDYAATLAKYETEPVDAVLLKAREICDRLYKNNYGGFLSGAGDNEHAMLVALEALKLPAMESSQ